MNKSLVRFFFAWVLGLMAFSVCQLSAASSDQKSAKLRIYLDPASPERTSMVAGGRVRDMSICCIDNVGDAVAFVRDIYSDTGGLSSMYILMNDASYPAESLGEDWGGAMIAHVGKLIYPGKTLRVILMGQPSANSYSAYAGVWFVTGDFAKSEYVGDWAPVHTVVKALKKPLLNVSTKTDVAPGQTVTVGFVIDGAEGESVPVLVRGVGPSLKQFGIQNPMANPAIKLYGAYGEILENAKWEGGYEWTASAAGAFPLVKGSSDALIAINLVPGSYTVQVTGTATSHGDALVEVYLLP